MKTQTNMPSGNVVQMPIDRLLKEGQSQQSRIVEEVMLGLFDKMPSEENKKADLILADGTKCWVKKFFAPRQDENGEWIYGFDVVLGDGSPISHLEFAVRCSGWERQLVTPTTE